LKHGAQLSGNKPSTAEKKAWTQGCREYGTPLIGRQARRRLENRVKGDSASGRAEVAEVASDDWKFLERKTALLREQGDKTRIGLVSGQALKRRPGDATAQFDVPYHFFQPRNGRSRESFSIKVCIDVSVGGIRHADCPRVLPCTAKEKFTEPVRWP